MTDQGWTSAVADGVDFDAEGICDCGAHADLDGTTCVACFEERWNPARFGFSVVLTDASTRVFYDAQTRTRTLLAA